MNSKLITSLSSHLKNLDCYVKENGEKNTFLMIDELVNELKYFEISLSNQDKQELKKLFKENIIPYTNKSKFCKYVYDKPRGYVGDFVTMEMIWNARKDPANHRYLGDNESGKIINAYTLDSPNCISNENRVYHFSDVLSNYKESKIASIGCGSAIEIQEFYKKQDSKNSNNLFYLLDSDQGAFDFIQNYYGENNNLLFNHCNVIRYILSDKNNSKFDLIYSSGMFDYFDIKSSKKLINKLFPCLNKGGKMIITNANGRNPSKFWMEYVMDWHLIYKNESEMYEISDSVNGDVNIKLETDNQGIYQYLTIQS